MPVSPPADASTTLIVVELHLSVPSDSGASVGTVYAETRRLSTAAIAPSGLARDELLELPLDRLLDDLTPGGVAVRERHSHLLRLFELDVRRQRRHLGIGNRLVDDDTLVRERLVPGVTDLVRRVDPDPLRAEQLGVARVRELRQELRRVEPRVAGHHALLPRDLVEVAVVQHGHDGLLVREARHVVDQ